MAFSLDMSDILWISDRSDHLVVVEDANLSPVNLETGTRISTNADPIASLAPRIAVRTKLGGVFVGQRADRENVSNDRRHTFTVTHLVGDVKTSGGLFLALIRHYKNAPTSGLRKSFQKGFREEGRVKDPFARLYISTRDRGLVFFVSSLSVC
jgi:hypothetical protein